jgi:hypothetical protein
MSFNPIPEYVVISDKISIHDFHALKKRYVTRPPYQRKNVWSTKKKMALMDSLFRRYYVPKLVLREVRLDNENTIYEVIDGQQRINTVQEFFLNKFSLPYTLNDINRKLGDNTYHHLDDDIKEFVLHELKFETDIVKNISDPKNVKHQLIATVIFERLQEGESLNFMEKAHARLSSLTRNVVVKYSDDITFDYKNYVPIDKNKDKLKFFSIIKQDNTRMEHLKYFTRLLLIEKEANKDNPCGYTNLKDVEIEDYIKNFEVNDGIGNYKHEKEKYVQNCISNLNLFHSMFKDDPMLLDEGKLLELSTEYIIISFFMLLRHIKNNYVFNDIEKDYFRNFLSYFYQKWHEDDPNNALIQSFRSNRQQSKLNLEIRDSVLRQMFFDYLLMEGKEIISKDTKRAFNESERIKIYRKFNGICQECKKEKKSERDCLVPWNEYQADHIFPHSKGGKSTIDNAQLLCRVHNQKKGVK